VAGYFAGQLQRGACLQPGADGLEEGAAFYLAEEWSQLTFGEM
jgi:hypothetical protein